MTYEEFQQALSLRPEIEQGPLLRARGRVVAGGMGGSALPADALRFLDPTFPIAAHRDYDLPDDAPQDAHYVALSYSGNTAETLAFARAALDRKLSLSVVTSGGALEKLARERGAPLVMVPRGMQPRAALFYQFGALLALTGRADLADALASVRFREAEAEEEAHKLAGALRDSLPHFYAARKNAFLAWVAKIHTNEGAKMPGYANAFSELNHNEMQSFDEMAPAGIASAARFVLLRDPHEDPRVARRMEVFKEVMKSRNRVCHELVLWGDTRAAQLARGWFVLHRYERLLAAARGVDPDAVPLIEDFKKRL